MFDLVGHPLISEHQKDVFCYATATMGLLLCEQDDI